MIVGSSWVLLVSIYGLFFLPETPFDLFLIRFCSCHSFFPFCFGISALGIFYLGALLSYFLWVIAGSGSCRVCYFFLYLIYFKKYKNIFLLHTYAFLHFCTCMVLALGFLIEL